jgi:hypothetical protein
METFREFFARKHGFPFPKVKGKSEEITTVLDRIADAVADWMDELAKRGAPHE